jgi:hypothetical protein
MNVGKAMYRKFGRYIDFAIPFQTRSEERVMTDKLPYLSLQPSLDCILVLMLL